MKHFIYFYRVYTKYLHKGVWWLLALTTLVAIADGLGISMLLPLLQTLEVSEQNSPDNILLRLSRHIGISGSLTGILGFMFVIFLIKAVFKFLTGYYQSSLYKELYRYLKINFYEDVLKVDYQYFTKKNTGHFITVMEGHVSRMVRSFGLFVNFITSSVMASSYIIIAGIISWEVSIMAVVLGGGIFAALSLVNKTVRRLSTDISREEKNMNQIAVQALHAFKYIVSTASYMPIKRQYQSSIGYLTELQFKTQLASAFTGSIQELMAITLLIAMILIEVILLGHPIGAVFVILLLFYRAVNQLMGVQKNWQDLVALQGYVESVDTEFDTLRACKAPDGKEALPAPLNQEEICFDNVTFKYQDSENNVFEELNLSIHPNTTVAIVGTSGAGKTTVVDLLTGLLTPQNGQITIGANFPLSNIRAEEWRSKIGYVAQDLTIFDDTVYNNIALFRQDAAMPDIENAARMASAHQFIEALPHGYNTRIGDKGVRLSGGQKQRLFIARELFKKPQLLILDEATSALDSESESYIQKSIDDLKGKITVVVIAHRLSTIRNSDMIYVLENGRVVEAGGYNDLLNQDQSKFSRMVNFQNV